MDTTCPPPSRVHWFDPFIIAAVLIFTYVVLCRSSLSDVELSLALVLAVLAVMLPIELARAPWRGAARPISPLREIARRSFIKWLGIMLGLILMLAAWEIIPEYRQPVYVALFQAMPYVLPFVPFVIAACILFTEWRMGPSADYAWHFGLMATGRFRQVDWSLVRMGLFGLLVRGFFLPLNFCSTYHRLILFRGKESVLLTGAWPQKIDMLDQIIFCMIVAAIVPGYLFSARLLGTEIRKVAQSWFAWVVTLLCYPPVNRGTGKGWFDFHTSGVLPWVIFFGDAGVASLTAGSGLLLFYLIHYWGEAICCLRSSHLTNRGIITNGPFRYCKHPVYLSKCLAWGLTFLPMVSADSVLNDCRQTCAFLAFCLVYAMRGWVEERLLSDDPVYVAYALWVDRHGLFRHAGRLMPVLNYRWRLQRWIENGAVKPAEGLR